METCTTMKDGKNCIFMKKSGCSYDGGRCHLVVEKCQGCEHVEVYATGTFCAIFAEPELKWLGGSCNMATHVQKEAADDGKAKMVNPLKASKRSRK